MILLYESTETEFDNNGLGALDHDILDPEIYEQLNGQYQFTFKYPLFAKHGKEILPRRIVTAKDTDGNLQWFRITQLSKSNGYATVTAVHGTFDLTGNWIADTNIVQKDGDGAMRQIQSMSLYPHQFMLRSDITTIANARMVRMTPTQAIIDSSKDNTFISRWGGQVYRDWNTITMLKRRGTDNGVTVRYRRDISSYTADVDYSTIYTVIHPVGPDGLELPEKYVESPNVEKYGRIVTELDCSNIKLIEPQTDSEEPTEPDPEAVDTNTAFQMMRDQAHDQFENGLDVPTSNFKIDIMNLANTKEYRDVRDLVNIHPWDTVTVIHEADDVEFKAQMISYKWIPEVGEQKGHYSQIELGTEVPTYTTETAKTVNKAIDTAETAKEKAKKVDGFEKIMAETSKAVEDVKEAVANAETDVKVATATANDAVTSADLAVKNAGFAKDTAQSALTSATNAQKDVETVTTNANQALNSAKTALTNAGDAIKTATDAKTTVTNLSTTVDSINGTLATLATNETVDKLSKTVTSQGTSITQNANAIALKADSTTVNTLAGSVQTLDSQLKFTNEVLAAKITKSDVSSMLGGYATQTWTTSEIKAQADSINLGVESVRQKVDGLQVGGRNYVLNSDKYLTVDNTQNYLSIGVIRSTDLSNRIVTISVEIDIDNVTSLIPKSKQRAGVELGAVMGVDGITRWIGTWWAPAVGQSHKGRISRTFDFTGIEFVDYELVIGTHIQGIEADRINVGRPKIEFGNKATDWSPSPEDMASTEWTKSQLKITESMITAGIQKVNTDLDGVKTTLQNQITATENSLKTTISTVQGNLDGLQVGGRNYFRNSSFENGKSFWSEYLPIWSISSETFNGHKVMTSKPTKTWTGGADNALYQDLYHANIGNKQVTVTFWAKADKPGARFHSEGNGSIGNLNVTLTTDWKLYKWTGTLTSITTTYFMAVDAGVQYWLSIPQIELGNRATDWSPAPEDLATQTQFSSLEQTVKGIQTTVSDKANVSELTQLSSQLTSKIIALDSNLSSQITQTKNDINLRLTSSQVQTAITSAVLADKQIKDTRNDNQPPSWYFVNYPRQLVRELKLTSKIGISEGFYATLETDVVWDNSSGGQIKQTAKTDKQMWQRYSVNTSTWGPWATIANTQNVVSQINLSPEGVLIAGQKVHITGQTTIDQAVIKSSMIESLSANKINVGTLSGLSLYGNSIEGGTIDGDVHIRSIRNGQYSVMSPEGVTVSTSYDKVALDPNGIVSVSNAVRIYKDSYMSGDYISIYKGSKGLGLYYLFGGHAWVLTTAEMENVY